MGFFHLLACLYPGPQKTLAAARSLWGQSRGPRVLAGRPGPTTHGTAWQELAQVSVVGTGGCLPPLHRTTRTAMFLKSTGNGAYV